MAQIERSWSEAAEASALAKPPGRTAAAQRLVDLLNRVGAGDDQAMLAVYKATYIKLLSVVEPILMDRDEAEDVLQDVYLSIWKRAAAYEPGDRSPISWLSVIARNRAIDRLRSRGRSPFGHGLDAAMNVADTARSALESLENKEFARSIEASLSQMDERASAAVHMALVDGDSYKSVAEHFQVPESTMKSIVRRALQKLRTVVTR